MEQPNFEPKYEPFDIQGFIDEQKKTLAGKEQPDINEMLKNTVNGKRGNGYILTYNNFTHTPDEFMDCLKQLPYIAHINFQIEMGQSGTIHYQGYTHHTKQVYWGQLRRHFIKMGLHRVTLENRIASPHSADDYCNKTFQEIKPDKPIAENLEIRIEEKGQSWFQTKITPDKYTWGDMPNYEQGKRSDIQDIIACVRENKSDGEIMALYTVAFFHNQKKINDIREVIRAEQFAETTRDISATFITGKTRIGKTNAIVKKHGYANTYIVDNYKNPFDKYKGQDVVVFDEFHGQVEITTMLRWLDFHPLVLPCRYSDKQACYTKVYFTSNEPFNRIYPNMQREKAKTFDALMARIQNVYDFNDPRQMRMFENDEPNENSLMPEHLKTTEQMTLITDEKELADIPF